MGVTLEPGNIGVPLGRDAEPQTAKANFSERRSPESDESHHELNATELSDLILREVDGSADAPLPTTERSWY